MELDKHENCQEYFQRRLSEGWKCISLEGYKAVLLSPEGIRRELDLRHDVETLRPSGPGDECSISSQNGAYCPNHYQNVDEEIADEDTTSVKERSLSYHRDLYNLPASSGSGLIHSITIHFRAHAAHGARGWAKPSLKSNDTVIDGTEVALPQDDDYRNYSQQWDTNPADDEPWEWADIDDLQIGVSLRSSSYGYWGAHCTQVYVEVDYTYAPPPPQYSVTIETVGQGTTDPAPGTYLIDEGTILMITASPDEGWLFDHWEGDVSGAEPVLEVQVITDLSIVAVFVEIPRHILTIETVGQGTTDPAPGTWEYEDGALVSVSAIPAAGWIFDHWEGDVSGTDNPVTFTITRDMIVTAVFIEIPRHILTIETVGQGTTVPAPGTWEYEDGVLVRVSAIPDAGWLFDHWEGDISGIENPVEFTITSAMRIVAVFSEVVVPPEQYAVSISIVGSGTTNPPHGTYLVDRGTILTITAYPAEGWLFDHWGGDISGTMNPVNIEVLKDISVVAVFAEEAVVPKPSRLPWIIGGILGIGLLAVVIKKKRTR